MQTFMPLLLSLALFLVIPYASAEQAPPSQSNLTIYSTAQPGSISPQLFRPTPGQNQYWFGSQIPGYAIVREQRKINLSEKRGEVRLNDVAAFIDPTTVSFLSLTAPKETSVVEQNYVFDLVSLEALANRYIDKTISVRQMQDPDDAPKLSDGTLISNQDGSLAVKLEDGSIIQTSVGSVIFPKLPDELFTKPTLIWDITTEKPGEHTIETSYLTDGLTWWADYNATYSDGSTANSGYLDIGAWVTIVNKSGASYDNTGLKLVAGDVRRVESPQSNYAARAYASAEMKEDSVAGFSQKSFFEFHLYTLGRKTSLPENSTKQIELFPKVNKIPVEKKLVYVGLPNYSYQGYFNNNRDLGIASNKKVDVYLTFKNDASAGLGIPLPAGKIRVNKKDLADNSLEFIGEDLIDHTPKNEEVLLKLGSAFDVVGERKQIDFQYNEQARIMDEQFEITLRNHKSDEVEVIVKETLYRSTNGQITDSNVPYKKQDAFTLHFPVKIPKDGEKKVIYSVRYTW